jgi:hypothetical protein
VVVIGPKVRVNVEGTALGRMYSSVISLDWKAITLGQSQPSKPIAGQMADELQEKITNNDDHERRKSTSNQSKPKTEQRNKNKAKADRATTKNASSGSSQKKKPAFPKTAEHHWKSQPMTRTGKLTVNASAVAPPPQPA